jgi:hypothetical protein
MQYLNNNKNNSSNNKILKRELFGRDQQKRGREKDMVKGGEWDQSTLYKCMKIT